MTCPAPVDARTLHPSAPGGDSELVDDVLSGAAGAGSVDATLVIVGSIFGPGVSGTGSGVDPRTESGGGSGTAGANVVRGIDISTGVVAEVPASTGVVF